MLISRSSKSIAPALCRRAWYSAYTSACLRSKMFCARAAASAGSSSSFFHRLITAVHAAWREALGVEVEVADDVPGQAHGVGLVVDRELARVAEAVGVGPQDPHARRVERAHPHRAGDRADERGDALAHLVGRLVGERDGEDPRRVHALVDEVGDAVREHPGLARPGAGDDQQRPAAVDDGVELVGVQPVGGRIGVVRRARGQRGVHPACRAHPTEGVRARREAGRRRSADDGDRAVGVGGHVEAWSSRGSARRSRGGPACR